MTSRVVFFAVIVCSLSLSSIVAENSYHKQEYFPAIPYTFNYGVKDEYNGADYGQTEQSDGKQVQGSYTVQLPDGRKQTVNYVADHDRGFVAEVSYQGQAQYPSHGGPAITFAPSKGGYH